MLLDVICVPVVVLNAASHFLQRNNACLWVLLLYRSFLSLFGDGYLCAGCSLAHTACTVPYLGGPISCVLCAVIAPQLHAVLGHSVHVQYLTAAWLLRLSLFTTLP